MSSTAIPPRIRANGLDRFCDAFGWCAEMVIHLELELPAVPDVARLRRALDGVLDAEPVLGCRYVSAGFFRAWWERLPVDVRSNLAVLTNETDYRAFLHAPVDSARGPQLCAGLWPRTDGGASLAFKVAHRAADAGGVREAVAAVARLYARLGEDPDYRPAPNLRGSRSFGQVLRRIPAHALPGILLGQLRLVAASLRPLRTCALRLGAAGEDRSIRAFDDWRYVVVELEPDVVGRIRTWGRARGATLNDLVVAAFLRAQSRACRGEEESGAHRLLTTVDLRRWHLPSGRAEGICNLSSLDPCTYGREIGPDLASTVERVTALSRWRKDRWIGVGALLGGWPLAGALPNGAIRRLFRLGVRQGLGSRNMANALTNLGPIDPDEVTFDAAPVHARAIAPPIAPPLLGVGISGYRGALTLSAGVAPGDEPRVRALLTDVLDELSRAG